MLVVKRPLRVARLIIGVDGSAHSRRAVELVTGLAVPDKGAVTLVAVLEPIRPVSAGLLPASLRATIGRELAALEAERKQRLQQELDRALAALEAERQQDLQRELDRAARRLTIGVTDPYLRASTC